MSMSKEKKRASKKQEGKQEREKELFNLANFLMLIRLYLRNAHVYVSVLVFSSYAVFCLVLLMMCLQ